MFASFAGWASAHSALLAASAYESKRVDHHWVYSMFFLSADFYSMQFVFDLMQFVIFLMQFDFLFMLFVGVVMLFGFDML